MRWRRSCGVGVAELIVRVVLSSCVWWMWSEGRCVWVCERIVDLVGVCRDQVLVWVGIGGIAVGV